MGRGEKQRTSKRQNARETFKRRARAAKVPEPQVEQLADELHPEPRYLDLYLEQVASGAVVARPVDLPQLPGDAPELARRLRADFEQLFAAGLACCDERPLIVACRWQAERLGLNYRTVHRAQLYLAEHGVVVAGTAPGRHGKRGTSTFARPGIPIPEPELTGMEPTPEALVARAAAKAEVGRRNREGAWLAQQMRDNRVRWPAAERAMRAYVTAVPQPAGRPYAAAEAMATLHSAYRRPPRAPWGVYGT